MEVGQGPIVGCSAKGKKILPLSEAELRSPLHPAEVRLGYFLAWFQSLQLPSTQSDSSLVPTSLVPFKVCMYSIVNTIFHSSYFGPN
jgi:hypothetical protein